MGFEVTYSLNESLSEVALKVEQLSSLAKEISSFNAYSLFFIYYSGHGASVGGETYGFSCKGDELIPVESYCKSLAQNENTNVTGFIDCCRLEE